MSTLADRMAIYLVKKLVKEESGEGKPKTLHQILEEYKKEGRRTS